MILIAKLSFSMDTITSLLTQTNNIKLLEVEKLHCMVVLTFEQRTSHKSQPQLQVAKLSTVKCKQGDQTFNQQQQQR